MRKFIYLSIIDRLKRIKEINGGYVIEESDQLPEDHDPAIKHFDLWNNNFSWLEKEVPFYLPAVLVEFQPIQWRHQGNHTREAAVTVVLHVLTRSFAPMAREHGYEGQALAFFELLEEINRCLCGHSGKREYFAHDALTSTGSVTDHDFDEIRHDLETFTCHAYNSYAAPRRAKINIAMIQLDTE